MTEARDMAGIALPFAAGAAAGSILFSVSIPEPVILPSLTAASLFISIILIARNPGNRFNFAIIFCLAGFFCSLNASLTAGIPLPQGAAGRIISTCYDRLRACIDSIPYTSDGTGPLVKALVTGDRSGLGKGTVEIFRASGASHILALSGLHLGVIYLILSKLTVPLGRSPLARKVRYAAIVGLSGFYTIMTGAAPSIVRAFLFIFINETGKILGRERNPSRVLLAALTIQLALKTEVITSVGFQLSYLAILGICTIYPRLEGIYPVPDRVWRKADPMRRIWQASCLSISCQMFTAPLVWLRFHSFPEYFLITNLLALPLTSAVMVLSVTTIVLSSFGICPEFLVSLNDLAVSTLTWCLGIISGL